MADEVTAAVRERADAGDEEDRLFGVDEGDEDSVLSILLWMAQYKLVQKRASTKRVVFFPSLSVFFPSPSALNYAV